MRSEEICGSVHARLSVSTLICDFSLMIVKSIIYWDEFCGIQTI